MVIEKNIFDGRASIYKWLHLYFKNFLYHQSREPRNVKILRKIIGKILNNNDRRYIISILINFTLVLYVSIVVKYMWILC